jgi:hypothetical protein
MDSGLRRWPRVHGIAGAGPALAAMAAFNQRRSVFMAIILLVFLRFCFRVGDNMKGICGTVLAEPQNVWCLGVFSAVECGRRVVGQLLGNQQQSGLWRRITAKYVTNAGQMPPFSCRSYSRITDIRRP